MNKFWKIKWENTDGSNIKYDFQLDFGKVPCTSTYPFEVRRELVLVNRVFERDRNGVTIKELASTVEAKIELNEEVFKCIFPAN